MNENPDGSEQLVNTVGRIELSRFGREILSVRVKRERAAEDLPLPAYRTEGAAGMDLLAAIPALEPKTLSTGERALVSTGLRLEIPEGFEAQVRPRSGLALRFGIGLVNSPGTIDSDYRGEIGVLLINWGAEPFTIRRGDRIAQLVFAPVAQVFWNEVEFLTNSRRERGGFGSTGV